MTNERERAGGRATGVMGPRAAQRLEYAIISLGVVALAFIFQPFSLAVFAVGCGLVVLAGLANNLLPLCEPGVSLRTLLRACLVVALVFCAVTLLSITAAYFYGVLFVNALAPDLNEPFYRAPLVWGIAVAALLIAAALAYLKRPGGAEGLSSQGKFSAD